MQLKPGEPAPSFEIPFGEGKTLSHDQLKGYNYILYFYPKDNTPGCTQETKDFQAFLPRFEALKTKILGVSRDSISSHKKFSEKLALSFPLLSDNEERLCRSYGVLAEKSMFGKKYLGIVRSTFLIDSQGVLRHEWRKVKVAGHVQAVLETVQKLSD